MKKILFTLIGMIISVMAFAQATNPDEADYFIKGNLSVERNGKGGVVYKLNDVTKRGITFNSYTLYGTEDGESVYFTMTEAGTDYPGGFNAGLQFWRYDEDIHEWQTDSEFRPSTVGFEETKTMAITMLIDCSGSLGADFKDVKDNALKFINRLYRESHGRGNINLGIIGFSTIGETEVFPMSPLTDQNYERMDSFIRSFEKHDGTALYYSMDLAVEMIEKYYAGLSDKNVFAKAEMIIFTDGLDQTSNNRKKDIVTTDEYFEYAKKLKNKKIGNVQLYSIMLGVRGVDIQTDAQLAKFKRIGNELNDTFILLENVAQLDHEYGKIADDLIKQWQNLKCYAPNSYKGRVAWTFRNASKPKPITHKQPVKKNKTFFGINVGVGSAKAYTYGWDYNAYNGIAFGGGLDLAFPISSKIRLGAFVTGGAELAYGSAIVEAGPLMLYDFKNGGSILGGVGYTYAFSGTGLNFRLGYKFKNGLYLFGNILSGSGYYAEGNASMIHIGYSF